MIRLDNEKRLLITAKTGCGKSFLARHLLKQMSDAGHREVIVDPKIDWQGKRSEFRAYGKPPGTVDHPVLLRDFTFHPEYKVSIIHPVMWSEGLGKFLMDIMYTGDTIIYFDEGTQLVSANFVPMEFMTIESQGRSKGVGVWYGTQRPVRIPVLIKDEASYIMMGRITSARNRQTLADYMNVEEVPELLDEPLPRWYFYIYDDEEDSTTLYAPLDIKRPYGSTQKAG